MVLEMTYLYVRAYVSLKLLCIQYWLHTNTKHLGFPNLITRTIKLYIGTSYISEFPYSLPAVLALQKLTRQSGGKMSISI